jgi:negative regulator of flagellin synthesis FlgM
MQINNNGISSNPNANTKQNTVDKASSEGKSNLQDSDSSATDSVNLSPEAKSLKALEAQIALSPDVDLQKVDQIKQAIEKGDYTINPETIANKIISSDDLL